MQSHFRFHCQHELIRPKNRPIEQNWIISQFCRQMWNIVRYDEYFTLTERMQRRSAFSRSSFWLQWFMEFRLPQKLFQTLIWFISRAPVFFFPPSARRAESFNLMALFIHFTLSFCNVALLSMIRNVMCFRLSPCYRVILVSKLTHVRKRLFEQLSGFREREFRLRTQF